MQSKGGRKPAARLDRLDFYRLEEPTEMTRKGGNPVETRWKPLSQYWFYRRGEAHRRSTPTKVELEQILVKFLSFPSVCRWPNTCPTLACGMRPDMRGTDS